MIQSERDQIILSLLHAKPIVRVQQLYAAIPDVSRVTVRRDVVRLARAGKLERVHGGIKRIGNGVAQATTEAQGLGHELADSIAGDLEFTRDEDMQSLRDVDAIVLPPIKGQLAKTIHHGVTLHEVFCLEESSPECGPTYLGIDNDRAGFDLGCLAGQDFSRSGTKPYCLLVGVPGQKNTHARESAFLRGLRESFPGKVTSISVDGGGIYTRSFRQARDAISAMPELNLVFGVNDHSILAALDAARGLRRNSIAAYCVGGEGNSLFEEFEKHQMLRGFVAMLPEVVARSAINAIARHFTEGDADGPHITPHRVITRDNIADYYHKDTDGEWRLLPSVLEELVPVRSTSASRRNKHSVLFIKHYRTHEWYQTLSHEMRKACEAMGYEYHTASVKAQVLNTLNSTRRQIAQRANQLLQPGDTIFINGGEITQEFAQTLGNQSHLTVITNSLRILEILTSHPGLKVILTGGSYRAENRDLIGLDMAGSLTNMRIDAAYLSVDGLTTEFGASCIDEYDAKCVRAFAEASRKNVVLADHSILGEDANFRAIPLQNIDEIVSDFGVPAHERINYTSKGIGMILAEDSARPATGGQGQ